MEGGQLSDPINPDHYKAGGIEVIDIIEAFSLDYKSGNCLKYLLRAGRKDPAKTLEDLRKSQWYLNRLVAEMEGNL